MERRGRDADADSGSTGGRDSRTDESATSSSRSTPVHPHSVGGSSGVVSREETPGPMPKYRYSRVSTNTVAMNTYQIILGRLLQILTSGKAWTQ